MGKRNQKNPDRHEELKAQDPERELTAEELEAQEGAELPDREAMSLINANLAAPINAAVAANVLSDNSIAYANAEQTAPIIQRN
jgi:spore germination cell wall hydrolase CwlJ-like protein